MAKIDFKSMLDAGVHFGHRACYWNPQMAPYLMKETYLKGKGRLHIFNLEKTQSALLETLGVVENVISGRGIVLFVGTKRSAQGVIQAEAERAGMPCMPNRWVGGLLTNFAEVRKTIDYYNRLKETFESGGFDHLGKKEKLRKERELTKLGFSFEGVSGLKRLPDALFVVDVKKEANAVREANKLGIPVIGVVDSNSSPEGIQYVIPGNDDASRAIAFYTAQIADKIVQVQAQSQPPKAAEALKASDKKAKVANEVATKIVTVKAKMAEAADESKEEKPEVQKKPAAKKAAVDKDAKKEAVVAKKKASTAKKASDAEVSDEKKKTVAVKKKASDEKKPAAKKKAAAEEK